MDDLVERNNLYYKKFTNVPFTGEISGVENGSIKKGKINGEWFSYFKNGQLWRKGNYKDGKQDGLWEWYYENGQLWRKGNYKNGEQDGRWEWFFEDGTVNTEKTGIYKNGFKVSD